MSTPLWGVMMLLPWFQTHSPFLSHEVAERDYRPAYLSFATGDWNKVLAGRGRHAYPWPVTLKCIGNSTASYQNYGDSPYFHQGLDMRADAGTPVYASVGGKILDITNYEPGIDAYWEVAIQDAEGFIWQYHHIDHDSMPQALFDALSSGTPIPSGTKLGEVYYWPEVSEGERYNHIHVNVAGKDMTWGTPFAFLAPLEDHAAPEFVDVFLTQDGQRVDGSSVSGNYSIAVHVRDLVLSDKFYLPPHALSYELDGGNPTTVWRFDTLPGGSSSTDYVDSFYLPGYTCGDYDCRRPVIDLGFSKSPHQVFPTTPGQHRVKITAQDFVGNATSTTFTWTVDR